MGQAKKRGTEAERIAQSIAKTEALKPDSLVCNGCKATIPKEALKQLDTRGARGIDIAFGGYCPSCGAMTWGIKGQEAAVQRLQAVVAKESDRELQRTILRQAGLLQAPNR